MLETLSVKCRASCTLHVSLIGVEVVEGLAVSPVAVASSGAGARAEKVGVTWGRGVAVCQCHGTLLWDGSLAFASRCFQMRAS